ncbi:MAG TPA: hypothetical protein VFV38_19930 [Ktedonobacteraceae bacterium]|nr:hypothetical protein [Ktedonobacteraceae bacterium]
MDEHRIGLKPILRRVWAAKGATVADSVASRYELDFVHFQRTTSGLKEAVEPGSREQSSIRCKQGCLIALGQPDVATQTGQNIVKGGLGLAIPGSLFDLQAPISPQVEASEGDEAGQAEQQGSGPFNSQVGPLPLCFDAQMSTALLKSRFQRPTMHEGSHDRLGTQALIGTQQRLDRTFARCIACEDPANGQRGMADAIPPGRSRTPRDEAVALAVPRHLALLPCGGGIGQDRFQRGQPFADHLRPATSAALLGGRGRSVQGAIEPCRSDEGHSAGGGLHTQFQATGSHIAQHADRWREEPAVEQAHRLQGALPTV